MAIGLSSEPISREPLVVGVLFENLSNLGHSFFVLVFLSIRVVQLLITCIITRGVVNSHTHINPPACFDVLLEAMFGFPLNKVEGEVRIGLLSSLIVELDHKRLVLVYQDLHSVFALLGLDIFFDCLG